MNKERNTNKMQARLKERDLDLAMQETTPVNVPRRQLLQALAAGAISAGIPMTGHAHGKIGIVRPPVSLPLASKVLCSDGRRLSLQSLLHGKTTALQLMFTGCSETCSLQGALFASIQQQMPDLAATNRQLLSLSIDVLGDDDKTLSAWLKRYEARQGWIAAVPQQQDIDKIRYPLQQSGNFGNNHSSQVYFINPKGQLIWRSEDFPPAEVVKRIFENASGI